MKFCLSLGREDDEEEDLTLNDDLPDNQDSEEESDQLAESSERKDSHQVQKSRRKSAYVQEVEPELMELVSRAEIDLILGGNDSDDDFMYYPSLRASIEAMNMSSNGAKEDTTDAEQYQIEAETIDRQNQDNQEDEIENSVQNKDEATEDDIEERDQRDINVEVHDQQEGKEEEEDEGEDEEEEQGEEEEEEEELTPLRVRDPTDRTFKLCRFITRMGYLFFPNLHDQIKH